MRIIKRKAFIYMLENKLVSWDEHLIYTYIVYDDKIKLLNVLNLLMQFEVGFK